MPVALQPSQDQAYLSRQQAKDVIGLKRPYYADYHPDMLAQLSRCRSDLDSDYFALLEALDNSRQLKIRMLFFRFDNTLSGYFKKTRSGLYGYLQNYYKEDKERMVIIEANMAELNAAIDMISKTLASYISPEVDYDEKLCRALNSIWIILKWRYYHEKMLLYPLYPVMQDADWLEYHCRASG